MPSSFMYHNMKFISKERLNLMALPKMPNDTLSVIEDDDYIWMGALSGWTVDYVHNEGVNINHRCGYWEYLNGAQCYMGNIIVDFILPHMRNGCEQ